MTPNRMSFAALGKYLMASAIVIAMDIVVGREVSLWVPLLLPVGLATWNHGWRIGMLVAAACFAALVVEGWWIGSPFSAPTYLLIALLSKATVFGIFVALLEKLRLQEVGRVFVR